MFLHQGQWQGKMQSLTKHQLHHHSEWKVPIDNFFSNFPWILFFTLHPFCNFLSEWKLSVYLSEQKQISKCRKCTVALLLWINRRFEYSYSPRLVAKRIYIGCVLLGRWTSEMFLCGLMLYGTVKFLSTLHKSAYKRMSAMENNYYPVNHQGFTTFVRFAMHNSGNVKIKKQTYEETEEIVVLCD